MADIIATFLIVVLPLAAGAEWWRMRNHCRTQIRETQARYRRDRLRTEEALAAAKRQVVSLQHQLTGARLRAQRSERPSAPESAQRSFSDHAPLLMLGPDRDPASARFSGFADTTVNH